MNFLFWNIKRKDSFLATVQNIVREEDIDIIAFAEFPAGKENLFEKELKRVCPTFKYLQPIIKNKIEIFYKDGLVDIVNSYDGERISANKIVSAVDHKTYILIFCHIWSKLYLETRQQNYQVPFIVDEIKELEAREGNEYTLVCGDFNMDVFQDSMLLHNGFNAMMTANIANKHIRKVHKEDFTMFYNPMWGLYGDLHGNDVAGTYYYNASQPVHQYWHMLDQVIMRPSVIPVFDKKSLKIVSKGATYNLLNSKGIIDKNNYSDHLPIKFKLNI